MNRIAAVVAVVTLALGIALFVFGSGPIRGTGGDVGIVVFGVASMAAVGLGSAPTRVVGMGAFAFAVEAFQGLGLVGPDAHWLLHLTLGSTFDWVDLLAYTVGCGIAAVLERAWVSGARGEARRGS